MDEPEEFVDLEAEEFYGFIRTHLICALFFLFSYLLSYTIIHYMKMRSDNDELYAGPEDYFVYRVSVWICSGSLSVSIGAVTLLPFSVLGSEVLQRYPDNFYLKWLNASLINSLWDYVFALSNLSLFALLPFSYFFIESQGFSSAAFQPFHSSTPPSGRRPLLARFYETVVVCLLVISVLVGIVDVFYSHLFSQPSYIWLSLLSLSLSLSTPLLYSFASFFGVSLLLLSVPLGFAKMFDVFSEMLIRQRPNLATTKSGSPPAPLINGTSSLLPFHMTGKTTPERLQALSSLRRHTKLQHLQQQFGLGPFGSSDSELIIRHRKGSALHSSSSISAISNGNGHIGMANGHHLHPHLRHDQPTNTRNGYHLRLFHNSRTAAHLWLMLDRARVLLALLKHPLIMLALLLLTGLSVSMVLINTLQLLFGFRDLPASIQYVEQYRHTLGILGALGEICIILYIMGSSLVGVYSIPLVRRLRPRRSRTSMTAIIINCAVILVLSSALPVLVRTLGITTFDLLGDYGRIRWISNFSLVWGYNLLFAGLSTFCLVNKFTQPVRRELFRRFSTLIGHKRFGPDPSTSSESTQPSCTDPSNSDSSDTEKGIPTKSD